MFLGLFWYKIIPLFSCRRFRFFTPMNKQTRKSIFDVYQEDKLAKGTWRTMAIFPARPFRELLIFKFKSKELFLDPWGEDFRVGISIPIIPSSLKDTQVWFSNTTWSEFSLSSKKKNCVSRVGFPAVGTTPGTWQFLPRRFWLTGLWGGALWKFLPQSRVSIKADKAICVTCEWEAVANRWWIGKTHLGLLFDTQPWIMGLSKHLLAAQFGRIKMCFLFRQFVILVTGGSLEKKKGKLVKEIFGFDFCRYTRMLISVLAIALFVQLI